MNAKRCHRKVTKSDMLRCIRHLTLAMRKLTIAHQQLREQVQAAIHRTDQR